MTMNQLLLESTPTRCGTLPRFAPADGWHDASTEVKFSKPWHDGRQLTYTSHVKGHAPVSETTLKAYSALSNFWLVGLLAGGLLMGCSDDADSSTTFTTTDATAASNSVDGSTGTAMTSTSTESSAASNTASSNTMGASSASATGAGGTGGTNTSSASSASAGGATQTSTGGTGGASTGGTGGAGTDSSGTGGSASGCAGLDTIICEDFESTPVGSIPEGWSQHGDEIAVADDQAYRGQRSLKMGAIPVWERRIYHDASTLGSAHWGRIHYKVQLPVPDAFVHSTLVALSGDGPLHGPSEFRVVDTVKQAVDTPDVGSQHQFLYNVQPENSGEFARQGPYDQAFDGEWHCAEYYVDASTQRYDLYIDGVEEISFEDGAGNYEDSDIPDMFDELRIGWINYQEAPPGFTAWIDEIAFASERIGCAL